MYFTVACKNVQRCQSAQFIKENLRGDLTSGIRALPKGKIWVSTQKSLTQLSSWKMRPDKSKLTIRKKLPRKDIHFLPLNIFKWKLDIYLKKYTSIKHKLFYAVPECTLKELFTIPKIKIHIHRLSLVLYFTHLVSATMYM